MIEVVPGEPGAVMLRMDRLHVYENGRKALVMLSDTEALEVLEKLGAWAEAEEGGTHGRGPSNGQQRDSPAGVSTQAFQNSSPKPLEDNA